MGFQVAFESENVFAQSNMSAGREFQVDGAATTEKARRASSLCMRGTTIIIIIIIIIIKEQIKVT